ncbi:hypothetical protein RHSIM_Rhsim04G0219800 [Rhododendron simsii]|uniref:Uncharacterized protein n=1 Tax=Rhododendron simsii TaxID=118357 RepID=A0A834LRA1_RHOSS|nr:hypothetical protein RHSIM_Rhsim04G0219800 [Rhododendron simsii]
MTSEISWYLRNFSDLAFRTSLERFGSLRNLPDYNGSLWIPPDTSGTFQKLLILEASSFFHIYPHPPQLSKTFLYLSRLKKDRLVA